MEEKSMEENNNPIQENGVNQNNNGVKKVNVYGLISFIFALVGLLIAGLPLWNSCAYYRYYRTCEI